jgi:hypothetical protein
MMIVTGGDAVYPDAHPVGISVFSLIKWSAEVSDSRASTWEKADRKPYFNPSAAKSDDRRQITGAMIAIAKRWG